MVPLIMKSVNLLVEVFGERIKTGESFNISKYVNYRTSDIRFCGTSLFASFVVQGFAESLMK